MAEKLATAKRWTIRRVETDPVSGTSKIEETPVGPGIDNPYSKFMMDLLESFSATIGKDGDGGIASFGRTPVTISRQDGLERYLNVFLGKNENYAIRFVTTVDENGEVDEVVGFRLFSDYDLVELNLE